MEGPLDRNRSHYGSSLLIKGSNHCWYLLVVWNNCLWLLRQVGFTLHIYFVKAMETKLLISCMLITGGRHSPSSQLLNMVEIFLLPYLSISLFFSFAGIYLVPCSFSFSSFLLIKTSRGGQGEGV